MTRYCQWARSEAESAQMQADGWTVDLHQPMTHHHAWAMLLYWPHLDREPPATDILRQLHRGAGR